MPLHAHLYCLHAEPQFRQPPTLQLHCPPIVPTYETKCKADNLQTKLQHCLSMHLGSRINDPKKQESWCWRWCHRNFECISAITMILGHVEEEFDSLDEQYPLLDNECNFVEVEGSEF